MNKKGQELLILPPRFYYEKEMELEDKENPDRERFVTGRLSEVRIQQIKRHQARRKEEMKDEIKILKNEQKRSRAINQFIKQRKYEQQKRTAGKSFHDLRSEELRILKSNDRQECRSSKKSIPERGNEYSVESSSIRA